MPIFTTFFQKPENRLQRRMDDEIFYQHIKNPNDHEIKWKHHGRTMTNVVKAMGKRNTF